MIDARLVCVWPIVLYWADENRYDSLFVLTEPNSGKGTRSAFLRKKEKRKLTQRRGDAKKRKGKKNRYDD